MLLTYYRPRQSFSSQTLLENIFKVTSIFCFRRHLYNFFDGKCFRLQWFEEHWKILMNFYNFKLIWTNNPWVQKTTPTERYHFKENNEKTLPVFGINEWNSFKHSFQVLLTLIQKWLLNNVFQCVTEGRSR